MYAFLKRLAREVERSRLLKFFELKNLETNPEKVSNGSGFVKHLLNWELNSWDSGSTNT